MWVRATWLPKPARHSRTWHSLSVPPERAPEQVTKIMIYVVHHRPEYLPIFSEARIAGLGDTNPRTSCWGVDSLAEPEYLIEVDAIAVVD